MSNFCERIFAKFSTSVNEYLVVKILKDRPTEPHFRSKDVFKLPSSAYQNAKARAVIKSFKTEIFGNCFFVEKDWHGNQRPD